MWWLVGGVFLRRQLEKVDETQDWLNHLTILNVISQELKVVPHPLCQYISENAILSNKQNTRCNRWSLQRSSLQPLCSWNCFCKSRRSDCSVYLLGNLMTDGQWRSFLATFRPSKTFNTSFAPWHLQLGLKHVFNFRLSSGYQWFKTQTHPS